MQFLQEPIDYVNLKTKLLLHFIASIIHPQDILDYFFNLYQHLGAVIIKILLC